MDLYKIALAARSAIYAPFFAAVQRANEGHSRWDYLRDTTGVAKALGDRGAYHTLSHDRDNNTPAQIAICDPMVVVEDAATIERDQSHRSTDGVIVAFILCRPTLWVISPPPEKCERAGHRHPGTVAYKTKHERNVQMGKVGVYGNCTASMILDYMRSGLRPHWVVTGTQIMTLGDEVALIANNHSATDQLKHVITCDGLLAQQYKPDDHAQPYHCAFTFHRSAVLPEFPFTAIVCQRAWLANLTHQRHVKGLLKYLQAAIDSLNDAKQLEATQLAAEVEFARITDCSLLNGRTLKSSDTNVERYTNEFERCLKELRLIPTETGRHASAFPRNISPEWSLPWIHTGWHFSLSRLWDIVDGATTDEARRIFEACSTPLLAPQRLTQRLRAWWWHSWHRLCSLNGIVYGFIGALVFAGLVAYLEYLTRAPIGTTQPQAGQGGLGFLTKLWYPPDSLATGLSLIFVAYCARPIAGCLRRHYRLWRPRLVNRL